MRSLFIFAVIGAAVGFWLTLILISIGAPSYGDYLIPLEQYQDLASVGALANQLTAHFNALTLAGLVLFAGLWFHMAGVLNPQLARLPLPRDRKTILVWGAWLFAGLLMLVSMSLIYNRIDPGYSAGMSLKPAHVILIAITAAGAWTLVSPQAFGRFGDDSPPFAWRSVARSAGLGLLFILLFAIVAKAIGISLVTLMTVVSEGLDRSSEGSSFGWFAMTVGMMVTFGLGYAFVFGALPAFVSGAGDIRTRLNRVRPALVVLAVIGVATLISLPMLNAIHALGAKRLAQVSNLSAIQAQSLSLVKLCLAKDCRVKGDTSTNPSLRVGKPLSQAAAQGAMMVDGGYVPLHADTVPVLEKFVADHRYSILRKAAMSGAAEVYTRLWQRRDAERVWQQFLQQGYLDNTTILWSQLQLAWLVNAAPVNAETRALLETMSDEKQYWIGNRAAIKLAAAWARFGDINKANELLARAKTAQPGKYDYVQLAQADLADGKISGTIAMSSGAGDIRVGLFRVSPDPARKPEPGFRASSLMDRNAAVRLTDSAVLNAEGRFSFENLSSGEYHLALLVPEAKLGGKQAVAGLNVPDLIKLNKTNSRRDLGVIRLSPQ